MKQNRTYDMHLQVHNEMADRHGFDHRALWGSKESQHARFGVLARLFEYDRSFSLVDLGCGLGHFYDYMNNRKIPISRYTGIDINERFVNELRNRMPELNIIHGDAQAYAASGEMSDYAVACGLFNIGETAEAVDEIFKIQADILWSCVNKGMGFNFLSGWSEKPDSKSIYRDPTTMFNYCMKRFGGRVSLIHDYLPHDFTILIKKNKAS